MTLYFLFTANNLPFAAATLDKTQVTAQDLDVTGQVTTNYRFLINNQVIPVQTDGTLQGQVPLSIGVNTLDIVVEDNTGQSVFNTSKTLTRVHPTTGLSLNRVLDIAPNGDVYVLDTVQQAQLIVAGSGTLSSPAWLNGTSDVGVTGNGLVYMLKGTGIWQYDGTALSQVADVSSVGAVLDMEVGPDDQVYLATLDTIYRVQAGVAVVHSAVPVTASGPSLSLDASAYGLVLASPQNGGFYRVDPDGSVNSLFAALFSGSYFAVNPQGVICFSGGGDPEDPLGGLGSECRNPDGSLASLFFNDPQGFDDAGLAYSVISTDNVYTITGGTIAPLITTTVSISGTLTIDINGLLQRDFTYNTKDELIGVNSNLGDETYAYDGVGNRVSDQRATDYQYNARNQLISGNGVTYDYDANGNRVRKTTTTGTTDYTWDSENQLIRIDFPNGAYSGEVEHRFWLKVNT